MELDLVSFDIICSLLNIERRFLPYSHKDNLFWMLTDDARENLMDQIINSKYVQNIRLILFLDKKRKNMLVKDFHKSKYKKIVFLNTFGEEELHGTTSEQNMKIIGLFGDENPVITPECFPVSAFSHFSDYIIFGFLYLLAIPHFTKIYRIELSHIFYLTYEYKFGMNLKFKTIEEFARRNQIKCYSFLIDFTVISFKPDLFLMKKDEKIEDFIVEKIVLKENCWNITHPFFQELSKLDQKFQTEILENLVKFTKNVDDVGLFITEFTSDITIYHDIIFQLYSNKKLKRYVEVLMNRKGAFASLEKIENLNLDLIRLYENFIEDQTELLHRYFR